MRSDDVPGAVGGRDDDTVVLARNAFPRLVNGSGPPTGQIPVTAGAASRRILRVGPLPLDAVVALVIAIVVVAVVLFVLFGLRR
jgi:hypothetical protein